MKVHVIDAVRNAVEVNCDLATVLPDETQRALVTPWLVGERGTASYGDGTSILVRADSPNGYRIEGAHTAIGCFEIAGVSRMSSTHSLLARLREEAMSAMCGAFVRVMSGGGR